MLRRRAMYNAVVIDYQRARPAKEDNISSKAFLSYSRYAKRNAYTVGVGYAGRDGATKVADGGDEGGSGVQLSGEWEHEWDDKLSTTAIVSWANKFFPKIRAELNGTYLLPYELTAKGSLSYRLIGGDKNTSLLSLGVGATKPINIFEVGADLRTFIMLGEKSASFDGHFFVNGSVIAKCYPIEGSKTNLFLTGSVGNAPEVSLIDNSMPIKFSQLNTMLGLGGVYSLNATLDFGLSGQWYTMSVKSDDATGVNNSKNYLYLNANVTIHF